MPPKQYISRGLAIAAAALVAMTSASEAQEDDRDGGFGLGIIAMSGDTPYGFTDTTVVPFIDFDSTYFRISGPSADLKLPWISTENLRFALRANFFSGEGYEASDDPILTGMAERKGGVWVGGAMDWSVGAYEIGLEALSDVGGDSDGSKITAEVSRRFFLGERLIMTPRLGAVWMDDKAVDYFYGVRPSEATISRATYSGSSTVNVEAGVQFGYMLTERQMLLMDISATSLGDGIRDSPIVVDDTLTSIRLGYMLRF